MKGRIRCLPWCTCMCHAGDGNAHPNKPCPGKVAAAQVQQSIANVRHREHEKRATEGAAYNTWRDQGFPNPSTTEKEDH